VGGSELADAPGGVVGVYGDGDHVGGGADGFCGEPGGVVVLEEEVAEGGALTLRNFARTKTLFGSALFLPLRFAEYRSIFVGGKRQFSRTG